MMNHLSTRELFDFLAANRFFAFAEFSVEIQSIEGKFVAGEILDLFKVLLLDLDSDVIKEFLDEFDFSNIIQNEGVYTVSALFKICHDSDDFRTWYYIEKAEIIEFEFFQTMKQYNRVSMIHSEFSMEPFF